MYAATKATVKKAFQSGVLVDDIAATTKVNTLTLVRTRSRLNMCLLYLVEICIESLSARGNFYALHIEKLRVERCSLIGSRALHLLLERLQLGSAS